jgi:hypothetical protein
MRKARGPLADIRIIDLSRLVAGNVTAHDLPTASSTTVDHRTVE